MMLEVIYLSRDPAFTAKLVKLLEDKTGQSYGYELDKWYKWIWSRDQKIHSQYPEFKSLLYGLIDPKLGLFLKRPQC